MDNKFIYQCVNCGKIYPPDGVRYLCPECEKQTEEGQAQKGILKIVFPYNELKKKYSFESLKKLDFLPLLPISSKESLPPLRIGKTPLYKIPQKNDYQLIIKDDSQNPTFSFKDRASALVSAFARENELSPIVAASTGNAGSSLAGICASQSQKAVIMVPASAPIAKLSQIIMYGARIVPVSGCYDDAVALSREATRKFGWYNRNTAFNPLTIEGKKTVSLEIYDQMEQVVPDRIFVPVGDAVIIAGVYKGFEDLLEMGFISTMPVIVAVQAKGSSNLAQNLDRDEMHFPSADTVADSISVNVPGNFYMARDFIKKYHGETCILTDDEILNASAALSKETGLFAEPAAAAAYGGFLKYLEEEKIEKNSKNLVLLTGSGLKDLKSLTDVLNIPEAVDPVPESLEKIVLDD